MSRDLVRDAQRVVVMLVVGFLLYFVLWGGVPFGLGFLAGRYVSPEITAKLDTIRISDSVYLTRTDTVVKYQRRVDTVRARSDALDSAVVIVDSVSVRVADTVAVIPPEVVADLRGLRLTVATQDTLIRSLYGRDSTQEWRIATHKQVIAQLAKQAHPLCGRRCGFVLGAASALLIRKAIK